jgi:NAD(P)-dependent dehydrogenase (short-subunit alcohol dehydrogenase family)
MRPERTVLVTGAGRGLGLSLAETYARRGWRVLAVHRDAAQRSMLTRLGPSCVPIAGDVRDEHLYRVIARRLEDETLDLVIHNAGVRGPLASIEALDPSPIRESFDLHCLAPLQLTAVVLPALRRSTHPVVGLIGSRWADVGRHGGIAEGGYYAYRIGKAALGMAGRLLADDLARFGVTVKVIDPGPLRTRIGPPDATRDPADAAQSIADVLAQAKGSRDILVNLYDQQ